MLSTHYLKSWSLLTNSDADESLLFHGSREATGTLEGESLMHQRPLVEAAGKLSDLPQLPSLVFSPAALRIIIKMIRSVSLISSQALFACVWLQTSVDAEPPKLHGRVTPAKDEERMAHRKSPSTPHLLHRGYAGTALPNAHFLSLPFPLFKAFYCLEVLKKQTELRRCVYWSCRFHLDFI